MKVVFIYPVITFIVLGISQAWAGPPNVVLSDVNRNTAGGESALFNTGTGRDNTAFGFRTLVFNGAGSSNSGIGANTLHSNTIGNFNTAVGESALYSNRSGLGNTAVGTQALIHNVTGSYNLAIGLNAGRALKTGGNNIYVNNIGIATESSNIRIGNATHARAFIAGIRGIKTGVANAVPVVIDSNGQLGTVNSSARFKKDIRDMNEASQNLLKLRPVTYRYKDADDNGSNPLEYGLIAEEVAKVYPDLVAYGVDGKIETVQYQKLTPMLLNELQHLNAQLESEKQKSKQLADEVAELKTYLQEVAELKTQVKALQAQAQTIQALTSRLSRIEAEQTVGLQEDTFPLANNRHLY
jgi:polyhydroxyalkanoate synthesis regulator phasin